MAVEALIVIDMINTYDHPDAETLRKSVEDVLPNVRRLIERARAEDIAVIYVNDNFGLWRSHHDELLDIALSGPHAELVAPIRPADDSLFVVKARHSIFYDTPLEYLLGQRGIESVLLCGQVTEQCILYSALDAHIRHLDVVVAEDACASIHSDLAAAALRMMERNMQARVVRSTDEALFGPA
ncbi:isochorismatase family cysteine hydrolase [Streptomyces sp. NPDC050147]|uniref:isochorismatase family cysteine hydrolase n=1 Tax=Streptomyces sp. NPDC050147 TaxID=3155513 RepID=UPI00341F33CA